jgi:hypothetical protein
MAKILLFIHGTGVRQAGYNQTLNKIVAGMRNAGRDDVNVTGFLWGDPFGCQITDQAVQAVLPQANVMAVGGDAPWEAALWRQLLDDPLFELRMAAIRTPQIVTGGAPLPGARLPDVEVTGRVSSLGSRIQDPLPGGILAKGLSAAAKELANNPVLARAAVAAPKAADRDLNDAIARAIVAMVLVESRGEAGEGPDALYVIEDRRALVNAVALQLFATAGLGGWLSDKIKNAAEAWGTNYGRKRREDLMVGAGPGVGDVLLYQRRGDVILDAIEKEIVKLAADGPIAVLGHSLGGIMLVDLLSRAGDRLPVECLVTVGSQAPALYVCDALRTMRSRQPLPHDTPFVPWLNVFDRNDFLSFCASRCFIGAPVGIEDFEVTSGVSFPEAHSSYFRQKSFYQKLAGFVQ